MEITIIFIHSVSSVLPARAHHPHNQLHFYAHVFVSQHGKIVPNQVIPQEAHSLISYVNRSIIQTTSFQLVIIQFSLVMIQFVII
jgi:hypothetical protein